MAPSGAPRYVFIMNRRRLLVLAAIAAFAIGPAAAATPEPVPVYTSEDLDRMFGPPPPAPSDPVDKSRPEDWQFVQQFLDRQYSRIDADREYDLDKRTIAVAENRVAQPAYPYNAVAWNLGYPASTWWNTVWSHYAGAEDEKCRPIGRHLERSAVHRGNGHGRGPRVKGR